MSPYNVIGQVPLLSGTWHLTVKKRGLFERGNPEATDTRSVAIGHDVVERTNFIVRLGNELSTASLGQCRQQRHARYQGTPVILHDTTTALRLRR